MKKIILTLSALALSMGLAMAQDLATATETYNNGATALSMDNKASALESFKSALSMAEALGEEGADIVTNCKDAIPKLLLSLAKDAIKDSQFDAAIDQLKGLIPVATEYGKSDIVTDATELIPMVFMQKGNNLLKAKDVANAASAFKSCLDLDPTNANAALRLGQALSMTGDTDGAVAAYNIAAANGQEATAKKQISNIFLKVASSALKDKKLEDAIDAAQKANEYLESANAYKIIGTAFNILGKKAEAADNLSKYLELAPTAKDAATIKAAVEALRK